MNKYLICFFDENSGECEEVTKVSSIENAKVYIEINFGKITHDEIDPFSNDGATHTYEIENFPKLIQVSSIED